MSIIKNAETTSKKGTNMKATFLFKFDYNIPRTTDFCSASSQQRTGFQSVVYFFNGDM